MFIRSIIWKIGTLSLFLTLLVVTRSTARMTLVNRSFCTQDSILLAQTVSRIQINENAPVSSTLLQINKPFQLNTNKKYCLFLDGVELQSPPEGVYEIYITTSKTDPEHLVPESNYFVTVLDTYGLTGDNKASKVCVNITKNLLKLNNSRNVSNYYITVVYKSNLVKDSGHIDHPGTLTIDKVKLIQIN